jgi:hypothetical protein
MDFAHNIRKYFPFTKEEIKGLLITILVIAFIVSFREWGTDGFNLIEGLFNLFSAILIVALGILAHVSLQRIYSYKLGYVARYEHFLYGILGGLVLCFASNGNLYFLSPGHVRLTLMPRLRMGEFRYGMNMWEYAKIAASGPLVNIILAIFFKAFMFLGNPLIEKAMFINIVLALFSMVPLPNTDGLDIFYGSRLLYFCTLGFFIGVALAIYFLQGIGLAIALGLFVALIATVITFFVSEEGFDL